MINVTIDNKKIQVPEGTTILKAARMAGIHIPTLCYFELAGMKFENKPGGCRVCVVEVTKDFNGRPRRNLAHEASQFFQPISARRLSTISAHSS